MTTRSAPRTWRRQWAVSVFVCGALAAPAGCKEDLDVGDDPPGPCEDAGTECVADGGSACVDLATDPAHCGSCDNACATGLCLAGECCEGTTPRECGGACVDVAIDPDNCGDCGAPCASGLCAGGACCEVGQIVCDDGQGLPECVDPTTDAAHCGGCDHACAGGVCTDGQCCEDRGGTVCEDAEGVAICADLETDPLHCGQCGNSCACRLGECCDQACGNQCLGPYGAPAQAVGPEESRTTRMADLDGDGFDDLIIPNQIGLSISVYWGNPEELGTAQVIADTDRVGAALAVGDVDEDGFLDIVAAVQSHGPPTADQILILYGDAGRTFERRDLIDEPNNPILMTLLRVDADEHLDLVMRLPGHAGWKTVVRRGDGAGGLGAREDLLDYGTLSEGDAIVGGDLDGDGRDELVETRNAPSNEILVHHFTDDGHVDDARNEVRTLPDGALAYFLALYDTDRDAQALPNIVAFEQVFADGVWTGWRVVGLRDAGTCTLADVPLERAQIGELSQPETILGVGDFDGNGLLDLAGFTTCAYCTSVHFLHLGGR